MPTMQPSTNYVVGEIADVQLANGQTVKAVIPTVNVSSAGGPVETTSDAIGSTSDPEWDGVAADATVISLLKKIATNTTPP